MERQPLLEDDCTDRVIRFYSDMVYRLAFARTGSRNDADDVFQEVFLRYVKKKPLFQTEEHRKAWLIRVTINCSKKFWNSWWKKKVEYLEEEAARFETREDADLYHELQQLAPKYREVIHLFYYEDLSIEEIGRILNRKKSTVRTQLTRARTMLRSILEEDCDVQGKV